VASGQGSGKILKGCGSSIQWDRGRRFKRNLAPVIDLSRGRFWHFGVREFEGPRTGGTLAS
jgi:hypothetical protein